MQEPDDLDWIDAFAEKRSALATMPVDSPERAAPIPQSPEALEIESWLSKIELRDSGITLGDLGIYQIPREEALAELELAEKPREIGEALLPGAKNIPAAGYGFELHDTARGLLAQARVNS
jgi:hypothetical protein